MVQFEPARQDSSARCREWRQGCEHRSFIESLLFFCCFLPPDTHLVFPGPIPSGEWILAPCGQLTFTLWGLAGLIGFFMLGSDSLSACLFYSRWYWRCSSAAFRLSLSRPCAARRGCLPFALPPSRFWPGNTFLLFPSFSQSRLHYV